PHPGGAGGPFEGPGRAAPPQAPLLYREPLLPLRPHPLWGAPGCDPGDHRGPVPQYLPAFDRVMRRTWGHMFNMFVMKGEKCDAYCAWLFPILEQLEGRVDYRSLDPFQARLFGRVSELLLD